MNVASIPPPPTPDRLERFRAARAKLDPAGDPADAGSFYVDSPRSVSARIAAELAIAPASTHLLVGGVGSGKTTELLATERRLTSIPDVATLYVDVTKQHDIAKMSPGTVIAQVGLALAARLEAIGRPRYTRAAKDVAFGSWQELEPDDEPDRPMEYVPGLLVSPEHVVVNVRRAREPLEGLLRAVRLDVQHLVVLLDGLDRITDLQEFEQLIHHDVKTLTSLGVGVVLVGPLRAQYGLDRVLIQRFDSFHYQPWIDVTRDGSGHEFLAGVLAMRAPEAFDPPAIEPLVIGSGGVLRDLLSLGQSALVEAYMGGAERVGSQEVDAAIESFGRKHLQGLRPAELEVLQRVRTRGSFVQTSEDDLALLMTRRVLEYRTSNQPRYAVHPTIDGLLRELAG
ncbi:MAG: hypothetical protein IAG13_30860 [Deltaproteobacteria bacterium]|nr:hypothetical protein [Nannocystaceae bacterium]